MLSTATGTTPSIPDRTEPFIPLQALSARFAKFAHTENAGGVRKDSRWLTREARYHRNLGHPSTHPGGVHHEVHRPHRVEIVVAQVPVVSRFAREPAATLTSPSGDVA